MKNKKVLLLGAGFTANFGAPVSSQVWNDLFNNPLIQGNKRLRSTIKQYWTTSDFEGFFSDIVHGYSSTREEKIIVANVVIDLYKRINSYTESMIYNSEICFEKLMLFLKRFSNVNQGKGFIFTLNQDLFLEILVNKYLRKDKLFSDCYMVYPYINSPYIDDQWPIQLPTKEDLDEWVSKPNLGGSLHSPRKFPFYIKLHGSSGWFKPNNETHIPIIGKNKSKQILEEPLLHWYIQLFDEIFRDKIDIYVIGYSFSDSHINEILMRSMKEYKSLLYVIDSKSYIDFIQSLKKSSTDQFYYQVNEQLSGYFSCYLKQIFSKDAANLSFYESSINKILNDDDSFSLLQHDIMTV